MSLHLFKRTPGVCLLQPGPGIGCCGLWTSASTTWRSPMLSCQMTLCTSVRPPRPPCAPGEPNSMCSVSQPATDTFFWTSFNRHTYSLSKGPFHSTETIIKSKNSKLVLVSLWRAGFLSGEHELHTQKHLIDERCGYKYIISSDSLILRPGYNGSIICLYLMRHSCRTSLNFIWICLNQPSHIHSCQLPHFEVWESDLANVTTETNYTVKKYQTCHIVEGLIWVVTS